MSVNSDKYNKKYKDRLIRRIEIEVSDAEKKSENTGKTTKFQFAKLLLLFKNFPKKLKKIKIETVSKIAFYSSVLLLGVVMILIFSGFKYLNTEIEVLGTSFVGPVKKEEEIVSRDPILIQEKILDFNGVTHTNGPDINAESYIAAFTDGFQVVAEKNSDEQLPFASIVKLLGVLVALDYYDMADELALIEPVDDLGNGLDLSVGESLSFEEILGAVIVGSKNDAMYILYQNYPGNGEEFINQMNLTATELGMTRTNVVNPIGLDSLGQVSTPRDLAILGMVAMKNKIISDYAGRTYYDVTTSYDRDERVWATNYLVGRLEGVIGLKTGYTAGAGLCLVSYVDYDYDFVTVVLNAEDRFNETEKLINWVKENY